MGGTALVSKNVVTRRYDAVEYKILALEVMDLIKVNLIEQPVKYLNKYSVIASYANKPTFGDLDVLLNFYISVESIQRIFDSKAITVNGDVTSFEYKNFQIDFIVVKPEEYDFAKGYFAYNDLGNLMGRVAHQMGFKFGHKGLYFQFKHTSHKRENILVTQDFDSAINFLGFNVNSYYMGFNDLEDIFDYVYNSAYFNPNIFYLDNRNNKAAVRDAKRPTYTSFLNYVELKVSSRKDNAEKYFEYSNNKQCYLDNAYFIFSEFKARCDVAIANYKEQVLYKSKFNGLIVSNLVNITGKDLGLFMNHLNIQTAMHATTTARTWILNNKQENINKSIINEYMFYLKQERHAKRMRNS